MEANARADADDFPAETEDPENASVPMYTQTPVNCHELITVSILGNLFAYILQNGRFTVTQKETVHSSHRIGQIKSVLEYIEQQYQNEITLSALAEVAGMNPKYFCRIFKEATGMSIGVYLQKLRLDEACRLLRNTDKTVSEIAELSGYGYVKAFYTVFKRVMKITPGEYRNG